MTDELDVAALKRIHKKAREKDQYERQAAKRHKTHEEVQRYKELFPELFAELAKQAKREVARELEANTLTTPTIVFTGELSITRAQASQKAEKAGFRVSNSVSKNTSYVVVGENPGSKLHKATQLGTEILDEEQFNVLLRGEKTSRPQTPTCRHCGHTLSEQMGKFARISGGFTCPKCHAQNRF